MVVVMADHVVALSGSEAVPCVPNESRNVTVTAPADATNAYVQGDKTLAIHTCKKCGCTTHWTSLNPEESARMAVNFRMCSVEDIAKFRIRHLDGADTWAFKD